LWFVRAGIFSFSRLHEREGESRKERDSKEKKKEAGHTGEPEERDSKAEGGAAESTSLL
jgi:hypothetical protein